MPLGVPRWLGVAVTDAVPYELGEPEPLRVELWLCVGEVVLVRERVPEADRLAVGTCVSVPEYDSNCDEVRDCERVRVFERSLSSSSSSSSFSRMCPLDVPGHPTASA